MSIARKLSLALALFAVCGAAGAMNHDSEQTATANYNLAFRQAAIDGDLEEVKRLARKQLVDVDHQIDGLAALHLAAHNGCLETVQWLVQEGNARVDLKDHCGRTALHIAARGKQLPVVQWFITEGHADLDQPDHQGQTALFWSTALIDEKSMETAQWLLNQGADPAGLYLEIPRQNRKTLLRQRNQYVCAAKEATREVLVSQDNQWQPLLALLYGYLGWKIVESKEDDGIEETMEKLTEGSKCCRSCVIL